MKVAKKYQHLTKAELIKRIKALEKVSIPTHSAFEREGLLHDLQVYQVELGTQNRELLETHQLLEVSRGRYADLYDCAPVGYHTLDHKGLIREINLTAAGILGVERSRLIGLPFSVHVMKSDLPAFRKHLRTLSRSDERAAIELRLSVRGGSVIQVELRSLLVLEAGHQTRLFRTAITDITRRKAAEAASCATEERLELALAGAELGLWDRDVPSGRMVFNRRWVEMLGYTPDEIGPHFQSWQNLVHPDDLPRVLQTLSAHLEGKTPLYEAELRLRTKAGGWRWVLSRGKVVARDGRGKPLRVTGTHLDITARKHAEEELHNNEACLRAILETAVESIITIDERGLIELFNPSAERMFGYTAKEVIGQNISLLMPALDHEDPDGCLNRYRQASERKIIGIGREVAGRRKDSTTFPLDLSVSEVQLADRRIFTWILRDITERKNAEEALRRSEAHLASAQEIAHLGSFEINVAATGGDHWSVETFRMLGLDPGSQELTPIEYMRRMVHREDQAHVREIFNRSVSEGTRLDLKYRIVRPDGSIRYVHSIAEPVLGPDQKVVKLVGSLQDITERWQLEKEVLEISDREQNRIGQDLHDGLCQHLAGIEFRLLSLKQKLAGQSSREEAETTELAKLVRQGIEQTRTLARGLSPVMMGADGLMTGLQDLAANTEKAFHLSCAFNCPVPVLIYDNAVATHLYRIAQEAVSNAIRHGKAKFVVINLLRTNDRVVLGVKDDGVGFPKKPLPHQGMGLRVMQYRAAMVGGSLVVHRDPEGGICVVCSLRAEVRAGIPAIKIRRVEA